MKRQRVGVDVDGVLLDFEAWTVIVLSEMGVDPAAIVARDGWDWDHLIPEGRVGEFYDRLGAAGGHDRMLPFAGAAEGIRQLEEVADVYILTSHLASGRTWVWERDRWLLRHFGISRNRVIHTPAKHTFAGLALIDDKPEHVETWAAEHPRGLPILWSAPYNLRSSTSGRIVRAASWSEVCDLVRSVIPA